MKTRTLKQILLYNYRYWFMYAIGSILVVYFLFWRLHQIGPGMAPDEITTAVRHLHITNFFQLPLYPLHSTLQWISLHLFGPDILAMRLPSALMSLTTIVTIFYVIKNWSSQAIALITLPLIASADWFLFIARLGTGTIEFSFWLALAILAILKALRSSKWWVTVLSISLSMLLFVPFGVIATCAIIMCLASFKELRKRLLETPRLILFGSLGAVAVAVLAFIIISFLNHTFLKSTLGLMHIPSLKQYALNILDNTVSLIAVWPKSSPLANLNGIFLVRFFELIFGCLGVYVMLKTRAVKVPIIVLALTVVLALASGLTSGIEGKGLLFVPLSLYIAVSMHYLIRRWRRTFPKNPYARIVAYVPLGFLVLGVVAIHFVSYFDVWATQLSTYELFRQRLPLLRQELTSESVNKKCIVVINDVDSFNLVNFKQKNCAATFAATAPETIELGTRVIVMHELPQPNYPETSRRALISQRKTDNIRWLVYEKQ